MYFLSPRYYAGRYQRALTTAGAYGRDLHGWALNISIRAKYAAIARLGPQYRAATGAVVKELTGIGRHCFSFLSSAAGAANSGLQIGRNALRHRYTLPIADQRPIRAPLVLQFASTAKRRACRVRRL